MKFGDSIMEMELSPHKYLIHAEKLKALAQRRDVYPVTVEIDPVDFCNHHCVWCVDPKHGHSSIDINLARRLLDELKVLGVMGIVYKGGGEPMLHGSFAELLDHAGSSGFEIGVVSNGSHLDQWRDAIVSRADYIRISIDGPTSESHRSIHGTDDFHCVLDGVAKLVEKRGRQRQPVIGISFAMDYAMIDLIDTAVTLGEKLGVDYILFRPPFLEEVGRGIRMTAQQAQMLREAFEAARRSYQGRMQILVDHWISDHESEQGNRFDPGSPRRGTYRKKGVNGIEHITGHCLASPLLAVVTADGTVYPCCNLRALDEWTLGRIDYGAGVTFRSLWEGGLRREVLKRIHQVECLAHCTHPLSKYNEAIEYLAGPKGHGGFV